MFVRTFCFFSFRRFFIFSLALFRISSTSRSRIFHTRILTRLRFFFCLIFFFAFNLPFSLAHTHACTHTYIHFLLLYLLSYTIDAKCFHTVRSMCVYMCVCTFSRLFSINQSSRSHFARRFPHFFHLSSLKFALEFFFFLFKSLHVLTHSLTLVNRFGSGGIGAGIGGRAGWLCD